MKIDLDVPDTVWVTQWVGQQDGKDCWEPREVPVVRVVVTRKGTTIEVNLGTEEAPLEWSYPLNQVCCPDWFYTKEAAETAIKYHYSNKEEDK
jgi:hypothetical protein